jgi:tight adherence protein B
MGYLFVAILLLIAIVCVAIPAFIESRKSKVDEKNDHLARQFLLKKNDNDEEKEPSALSLMLEKAGINYGPTTVIGLIAFFIISFFILGVHFAGIGAGVVGSCLVPFLAMLYFKSKTSARQKKFDKQLGDCLPMIAENMRSGMRFEEAIGSVADYMEEPIRSQFKTVSIERSYGVPLTQAMENLSRRVNCKDMALLTAVVSINAKSGGNMADILDSISETILRRSKMRGHVASITASGRMSAIMISSVPPGVLAVMTFTSYDYVSVLYTTPIGWIMLAVAAIMIVTGLIMIQKLYRIRID